ncbi:1-acyl-sn-glycerol-3-phosphate acyltransferase [Segetibacter sp.]|uniref:1-acyl-sn-glycerol-3-phosphate acyltransferase n=1 Tax=Segetibacter sp. TaxID=2231182 RepID=UPI0026191174|nr:1-acyl-sn-glycerol-3-phosphate acyltransferase [Segetibacter sp.]MCW3080140.1 phospholipid/glycerol acyltransferase [Segetibacter sp.]
MIFFRKIVFESGVSSHQKGPLLLACNHPNSFLDALLIGSYFKHPVHFLARGDAFKNPLVKKILSALKVIPIYRLSEGKECLALNDTTFGKCTDILVNGGIVLIFSEGLCLHQWKLTSLKKGTARIALNAWKQPEIADSFCILPVSLNYSSFTRFRKNVIIDFGDTIRHNEIPIGKPEGQQIIELNKLISARLEKGLLLEANDQSTIQFLLSNFCLLNTGNHKLIMFLKKKQTLFNNRSNAMFDKLKGTKKVSLSTISFIASTSVVFILFIPAGVGLLLHLPLYAPFKNYIKKKTQRTVFFHSALFGGLIIIYPAYSIIMIATVAIVFESSTFFTAIVVMPFLAFIALVWMDCLERIINHNKLSKIERKEIRTWRFK